jgi:tetratricopeptide (TPR) repeat protein
MPARTYMIVDPRHDHGFSIPRPDLTATIGTPNACSGCHGAQTPEWAVQTIAGWSSKPPRPHFGTALAAGRRLGHNAHAGLTQVIADREQPAIVRATALNLLPAFALEDIVAAVQGSIGDANALVRTAACTAAMRLPLQTRAPLIQTLLDDPVRLVRIEAGRALASSRAELDAGHAKLLDRAVGELKDALELNADQPQAHAALGALYAELGMMKEAQAAYETALAVGPYFIPIYINLADLYRAQGRDDEAAAMLRRGLNQAPDDASLHHSLGLTLVRQKKIDEALAELQRAHEIAPAESRYAYVYGVALNSTGRRDDALAVLEKARAAHPADADILIALSTMHRDAGDAAKATLYAEQLVAEWPGSQGAQALLATLKVKDGIQ